MFSILQGRWYERVVEYSIGARVYKGEKIVVTTTERKKIIDPSLLPGSSHIGLHTV